MAVGASEPYPAVQEDDANDRRCVIRPFTSNLRNTRYSEWASYIAHFAYMMCIWIVSRKSATGVLLLGACRKVLFEPPRCFAAHFGNIFRPKVVMMLLGRTTRRFTGNISRALNRFRHCHAVPVSVVQVPAFQGPPCSSRNTWLSTRPSPVASQVSAPFRSTCGTA